MRIDQSLQPICSIANCYHLLYLFYPSSRCIAEGALLNAWHIGEARTRGGEPEQRSFLPRRLLPQRPLSPAFWLPPRPLESPVACYTAHTPGVRACSPRSCRSGRRTPCDQLFRQACRGLLHRSSVVSSTSRCVAVGCCCLHLRIPVSSICSLPGPRSCFFSTGGFFSSSGFFSFAVYFSLPPFFFSQHFESHPACGAVLLKARRGDILRGFSEIT